MDDPRACHMLTILPPMLHSSRGVGRASGWSRIFLMARMVELITNAVRN